MFTGNHAKRDRHRNAVVLVVLIICFDALAFSSLGRASQQPETTLAGIIIQGNTVYEERELLESYQDHLGASVTTSTVKQIARAIRQRYHGDGHRLAQVVIPTQQIMFGIVRLRVYEGVIENITLEGGNDAQQRLVEARLARLRQSRPFSASVYDHTLRQLNALPGLRVRGELERLAGEDGIYGLTLHLYYRRWKSFIRADNRGSEAIGPIRIFSGLDLNSPFGLGERFRLRLGTAESTEELRYLSLSGDWPVSNNGIRLNLSGAYSRAEPGAVLGNPNTKIDHHRISFGFTKPLLSRSRYGLDLTGTFSIKNNETREDGNQIRENDLRIFTLGLDYHWNQENRARGYVWTAVNQGVDALGADLATAKGAANAERDLDFTHSRISAYYRFPITLNTHFLLRGKGQYSNDILPSSERFLFGGRNYGRGYEPAEISGDSGAAIRLELGHRLATVTTKPKLYSFYDGGITWRNLPDDSTWRRSAASAGAGVELGFKFGSGFVEVAKPLTREVRSEGNKDLRLFAGFRLQFQDDTDAD